MTFLPFWSDDTEHCEHWCAIEFIRFSASKQAVCLAALMWCISWMSPAFTRPGHVDCMLLQDVSAVLQAEYPQGVDVVYEGVGGALRAAIMPHLAPGARVLQVGRQGYVFPAHCLLETSGDYCPAEVHQHAGATQEHVV